MTTCLRLLCLLLPLLCGAWPDATAGTVTLRVAAQEGTEPKFIARGGAVVGLCVDILRAIEKTEPGLTFTGDQHWMPLVRVYAELARGEQDAACGVQRTADREGKFVFLEPSLFPINYMLMARADDPIVINNWDDVRNLGPDAVVLANRGFASVQILQGVGGLNVDARSASPSMNLQKLIAGRGRLFLHRTPGLQAFLERSGATYKVRILPVILSSNRLYLVLGKHVDHDTAARVQHALTRLEKSGELERLLHRWDGPVTP
ncbi:transporter substrate-binding domain-containing protein [Duganella sp. LX20W]|uniref:Transporter substrate-binding domain-containing protein n=1 Tax=Rugamonas brunnea TaxID=2758569 RepID=A0A7W2ET56_9BURK|nr:transporter substrate-binding domain-containing protein [Rugamonas brunnea]MBA5638154.1 transporter substrate-binding domain-containing protein [Rugamonas brunnea]